MYKCFYSTSSHLNSQHMDIVTFCQNNETQVHKLHIYHSYSCPLTPKLSFRLKQDSPSARAGEHSFFVSPPTCLCRTSSGMQGSGKLKSSSWRKGGRKWGILRLAWLRLGLKPAVAVRMMQRPRALPDNLTREHNVSHKMNISPPARIKRHFARQVHLSVRLSIPTIDGGTIQVGFSFSCQKNKKVLQPLIYTHALITSNRHPNT